MAIAPGEIEFKSEIVKLTTDFDLDFAGPILRRIFIRLYAENQYGESPGYWINIGFDDPDPANFINYDSLTGNKIVEWTKAKLGTTKVAEIEAAEKKLVPTTMPVEVPEEEEEEEE